MNGVKSNESSAEHCTVGDVQTLQRVEARLAHVSFQVLRLLPTINGNPDHENFGTFVLVDKTLKLWPQL
jgi:hypothetical protein